MPQIGTPARNVGLPCKRGPFCFTPLLFAALLTCGAGAQEGEGPRLTAQSPFDLLTLDKANDSKVLKIHPVDLPGRRVPEKPKPSDKLRIRLMENDEEYEVAWTNIAKLELYEQMVLAEAGRLTAEGKLDEAYDHFAFLLKYYPNTPGLAEARQNYLYLSAGAAFRQRKYEEALAVLEELLAQNANYRPPGAAPPIIQTLGNIVDPILTAYLERKDFSTARALLMRLARQYRADQEPFVQRWRQQLADLAARSRDEAKQHLEAGRFIEAHDAARSMRTVWPDLAGAAELLTEVTLRHPLVAVGVEHPAVALDGRSLHDVAARRAGRLGQRMLVEMTALGPEGGQYECPLGTLSHSDDGLGLAFHLAESAPLSPYELMQRLLARAEQETDDYVPAWARIVSRIGLKGTSEVAVELRLPHVLPAALLRSPLDLSASPSASALTPYRIYAREPTMSRYTANPEYVLRRAGQPAEIVERLFDDPVRLLRALRQGEIDVIERVFPGDIGSLQSDREVAVAPYQAPTTHVIVVRSENPYLANRTFRRALVYGANRELLLEQGLLRGNKLAGFRVVSGPFAAPSPGVEVPAYGYDRQIEPKPYDPRLAMTLRILAEGEIKGQHEARQAEVPRLAPLTLGHPADEVSRIACRGLARQWKQIGVECNLLEFPRGVFDDAEHKCDLVYLQLSAWEPIVDAGRIFGEDGLAPTSNPFIQLALRQIDQARNWQEARERLLRLHRLVHEEVALLPLWQTMDHYAYRRNLQALAARRLHLYQDVEQWQAAAQLAGTAP